MNKNTATIVISGVIGLLIGALGTWVYMGGADTGLDRAERGIEALENATGTENTSNEGENTRQDETVTPARESNRGEEGNNEQVMTDVSLVIQDQPAGDSVRIESVSASRAAWVVISEDVNGTTGRILGARLYEPRIGVREVPLLRPTVAGMTYHATFYADTNGDRLFDHRIDTKIGDQAGSVVFRAQ